MDKFEKIKKAYDRCAPDYDAAASLQRSLADRLVDVIQADSVEFSSVLDIGCGTGYLLGEISAYIYGVGCDISFGMLACARMGHFSAAARYVQSDARALPFIDSVFDIVVSNAAYQWLEDLALVFRKTKAVLKPAGRFYFTIFNNRTLWQLKEVCGGMNIASANFPDKAKVFSSLQNAGFEIDLIETHCYEKYYKDLWGLLGALKNIGSTSADNKNINGFGWRRILNKANDLYLKKFGNSKGLPATYEAFLVKAC
jgi:malonyl-CoA O-methyltransferase